MSNPEHSGRTILVVEDDATTAESLTQLLFIAGYESERVGSLAGARDALSDRPGRFGLMLLDIVLPDGNGIDFLKWVREKVPDAQTLPVIVVTSRDSVMDRVAALEAGASDFVTKPFHLVELKARIGASLREAELRLQLENHLRTVETALAEQKRLADELEAANRKLRRLSEVKDQFIGIASHDLRSPLTNVKGYTELLLHGAMGEVDGQQADALRIILKNTDHLLGILNNLLDISRIDSGTFSLAVREEDLAGLLRVSVQSFEARAMEKGILLAAPVIPQNVPPVACDGERVLSIFENLLSNAIKFCRRGDAVRTSLTLEQDGVRVEVADTGPGIPEAEIPRVFTRFSRLSVRPSAGEKSTGLGLSLVKTFVEMHGGSVAVRSRVGEGTSFSLYLPFQAQPES